MASRSDVVATPFCFDHCRVRVNDLFNLDLAQLETHFGRYGMRLDQLARGIDHDPVVPNQASKSIFAEGTFQRDIPLAERELLIRRIAEKVWNGSRGNADAQGRSFSS
jgi:DNA polymerase-4